MRKRLLAGNWKMNLTLNEAKAFVPAFVKAAGITGQGEDPVDVLFATGYTLLHSTKELFDQYRVTVAAQNCHWEMSGAFTGEVSFPQLKDLGIGATLIGHSERRQYFGETDETVNAKVKAALEAHIWPIACIGETLEERESGKMQAVITRQVRALVDGLDDPKSMVIAYEPVWAIGTGKSASTEQAQEVHALIRSLVADLFSQQTADHMRILYGGSAKPANIGNLVAQPDIDGALVGGASLKPDQFGEMFRIMAG